MEGGHSGELMRTRTAGEIAPHWMHPVVAGWSVGHWQPSCAPLNASIGTYRLRLMVTRLPALVRSRFPLRYHSIQGSGVPSMRQASVMLPRTGTVRVLVLEWTTAAFAAQNKKKRMGD